MKTRYYVCGLGYDVNDCITDYEQTYEGFDTYEEAYELFVRLQCSKWDLFFFQEHGIYQLLIQLEECEESDDEITCIDVKNEWWVVNPNYEEEVKMNKKNNMAYWDAIDALTEGYVKKLVKYSDTKVNLYGSCYEPEDIKEMDEEERKEAREDGIMEIAKDITEFAVKLLEEHYGANFPYVDENY
jgi:hypothetical protein